MIGKAERECRAVRRLPPGTLGSRASRSSCKRSRTTAGASAVHRYYDPTTGQFLTVDPLVSQTGQPFSYANDDPVNGSDPSGLTVSAWLRDVIDVPQDVAYLEYWGSYEAIGHTNSLAKDCGPLTTVCSTITHTLTAPDVLVEAAGLGGDTLGNLLKGENIWQEGQPGQPLFGNQFGGIGLSNLFDRCFDTKVGRSMTFPGLRQNGTIDFAW